MVRAIEKHPGLKVYAAGDVSTAEALLRKFRPRLVVSDIGLPDGTGLELIQIMEDVALFVPVIFITAYIGRFGSLIPRRSHIEVHEKPVSIEALRRMVEERLHPSATLDLQTPFSVADYVQLAEMGRRSVVITVEVSDGSKGEIIIRAGQVWWARDNHGEGDAAFRRLVVSGGLGGDGSIAQCRSLLTEDVPRNIEAPMQSLLLDTARELDEASRDIAAWISEPAIEDSALGRDLVIPAPHEPSTVPSAPRHPPRSLLGASRPRRRSALVEALRGGLRRPLTGIAPPPRRRHRARQREEADGDGLRERDELMKAELDGAAVLSLVLGLSGSGALTTVTHQWLSRASVESRSDMLEPPSALPSAATPSPAAAAQPEAIGAAPALEEDEDPSPIGVETSTVSAKSCPPQWSVPFAKNEARPRSSVDSSAVAGWLSEEPGAVVLVDGHADPRGNAERNLMLSLRRAKAVARQLRRAGIVPRRIQARAFGEYVPLDGPEDEDLRRVTVHITGIEGCSDGGPS
ncbi:MAG: OmpA family protein [Myxococcales bacterium]|nr:OmpA family protein [Myxococcales bacterium]